LEKELKKGQSTEESLLRRISELEEELARIRRRPYDVIFDVAEKNEGTSQLLGIKDYEKLFDIKEISALFQDIRKHDDDLTPIELFKYGLLWARQGLSQVELGIYLNRNRSSAGRRMVTWVDILYPWAKSQITFFDIPEWLLHHPEELRSQFPKHLFFFVDGTVLKMWAPSDSRCRRKHYNSKHGCHAWIFFVVVDPSGHIVFLSNVDVGSKHDSTHWNEIDVASKLEKFYENMENDDGYILCLGGDKAYPGIDLPKGWHLYVTMSAEEPIENQDGTDQMNEKQKKPNQKKKKKKKKKNKNSESEFRDRTPEIAR